MSNAKIRVNDKWVVGEQLLLPTVDSELEAVLAQHYTKDGTPHLWIGDRHLLTAEQVASLVTYLCYWLVDGKFIEEIVVHKTAPQEIDFAALAKAAALAGDTEAAAEALEAAGA